MIPFQVHLGTIDIPSEAQPVRNVILGGKQSRSEPDFWVVYQVGAFQPGFFDDLDPNGGLMTAGMSSQASAASNDTEAGTIVFAEVMRELVETTSGTTISLQDLKKAISVHEIGHEFGIEEGILYGLLMDVQSVRGVQPSNLNSLEWSGLGLRRIMLTRQPGDNPQ